MSLSVDDDVSSGPSAGGLGAGTMEAVMRGTVLFSDA